MNKRTRALSLMLVFVLCISALVFTGCNSGKKDDTVTATPTEALPMPTGTDVPTQGKTDAPEPTGSEAPKPSETDTPKPTDTDTPKPTETDAPKPTDTPTVTTEKQPDTPDPDVKRIAVIAGGGAGSKIYSRIVKMAEKNNPRVVILTTAGKDTVGTINSYVSTFKAYTNDVEAITLCTKLYDPQVLHDLLCNADIICEVGGQTEYMQEVWAKYKVDEYLAEAYNKGVIICGGSAGGMCWTYAGWNDFLGLPKADYKFYYGLDLLHVYYGPHYDQGVEWTWFDGAIRAETNPKYNVGYAMDNGTALVFINEEVVDTVRESTAKHIYQYTFENGAWTRAEYKY